MVGRWPNGWMDQDNTWHGGGPRSRSHCARLEPSSPPKKGHSRPIFGPFPLWPNCSMHQDATWYGGRLRPRPHYARWGPSFPFPKKGTESPQFSVHAYCGKTAVWIMMSLGTEVELSPGHIVLLDGDPAPFPRKGHSSPPPSFQPMSTLLWPRLPISATVELLSMCMCETALFLLPV